MTNLNMQELTDKIKQWTKDRKIDTLKVEGQMLKLVEEHGELGRAIAHNNLPEIKDAIGDMFVVLTNVAMISGLEIEDCVQHAYDIIKHRKGEVVNGVYVKEENLKEVKANM